MEKPGMGRRDIRIWPGLLAACRVCGFFAVLSAVLCPAFSQETGYFPDPDYYLDYGLLPETAPPVVDLEVLLETSPEIPEAHAEWTVRVLVNHPNPQEVSVIIPDLPSLLVTDRIRTAARFVRRDGKAEPEAEERWTVVEFVFIPGRSGPVSLAPFEVRVPGHLGYSPLVSAVVRGGNEEEAPFRAAWESSPSLRAGQGAEIRLLFTAGQAGNRQDASVSYRPEAPINAIVEPLGVEEVRPGEFILRFWVIPLEGPSVRLPPALLKYGDASLTVPGREFAVLPPAIVQSPAPVPARDEKKNAGGAALPAPAFPASSGAVFPPFRAGYEWALEEARSYWDQALYAEALAVLRLNERELAAGPALVPVRRSAENALGIGFTEDERWRPRRLFLVLAAAASFALGFILFAAIRKGGGRKNFTVTSGSSWGYTFIVILLFVILGTGLCGFFGGPGRVTRPGKSRTGVLREVIAARVPEDGSVSDMPFREGEPVRIRSLADAWAYVESFEGKAGWVPLDRIIPY